MIYVSFAEIFIKSTHSFGDAGFDDNKARIYATLCFFAGVVAMILLNHAVTYLLGGHHHHDHGHGHVHTTTSNPTTNSHVESVAEEEKSAVKDDEGSVDVALCPCCDDDPVESLDNIKTMAESMYLHPDRPHPDGLHHKHNSKDESGVKGEETQGEAENVAAAEKGEDLSEIKDEEGDDEEEDEEVAAEEEQKKKLARMSLNTALAIGIHNFPEGLATFVAALNDPKVGAVLAIAIAIHNIPEGLCVAMPIYYATGNKWKAFGWAMLSGIAEPIAGLLGWLILAQSFSDQLYAILFGMVAGMMVIISVRELLPTAHRYDPEDSVDTNFFILGMGIMALSLLLFLL